MAGRTGGKRVKGVNLEIVRVIPEQNVILLRGSIPGYNGSTVIIER
jgi:large subunit ribosomal protein L3